jgi:hypothetical protein
VTSDKRHLLRTLAVLLGGSLLGVVSADLAGMLPSHWGRTIAFALAAGILILWGSGAMAASVAFIRRYVRDSGWRKPLIGILTGLNRETAESIQGTWTDIPASQWEVEIRRASESRRAPVRIRLIPATRVNDSYAAIVNPFGGTGNVLIWNALNSLDRQGDFVNTKGLRCLSQNRTASRWR